MPPPDSLRRDDPPALRKSFSTLPAEIQQMIWSEAIAGLSCHHFKLKKDIDSTSSGHWVVHLKEKPKHQDASAYREWKRLWQVRNKAFVAAFRFYHRRKKIQPVNIFKPRKSPTYWPTAAISFSTDLVILSLERGVDKTNFTWFEHMAPFARSSMNFSVISSRLQHFGRVAIHYKHGAIGAKHDGIFTCYCPPGAGGCKDFNACAHELACFLDCFKKLEAFYFVLDPSLVPQQDFGTDFKKKAKNRGYKVPILRREGETIVKEVIELARFSDITADYLEHPRPSTMAALGMDRPSPFENARQCLIKTIKIYKNKVGQEPFHTSPTQRDKVKFGMLIPYQRGTDDVVGKK